MGNALVEPINLHPPETAGQVLVLIALVGVIGVAAWRRAGARLALVAMTLGLVCYVVLEPHPYIPTAILPALLLDPRPALRRMRAEEWPGGERGRAVLLRLGAWGVPHGGSLSLATLLLLLLAGKIVRPGFTDYWGYHVAQVLAILVAMALSEARRDRPAPFTWETRALVVVTVYADCLGTAADLYARFVTFDKVIHFAGTASATMVCAELVALMARRGKVAWRPGTQIAVAVAVGLSLALAWELYEYLGDAAFNTGRVQSRVDTRYDLISDSAGAIVAALLVVRRRAVAEAPVPAPAGELAEAD